jgi:hypothetical protein
VFKNDFISTIELGIKVNLSVFITPSLSFIVTPHVLYKEFILSL